MMRHWQGLAGLILLTTPVAAQQLQVTFDGRVVASDARRSFLDGGLGKLRYGDATGSADLGRLRLGLDGHWGESLRYVLDASAWSTRDTNAIDLTEAYLEWRPVPSTVWRSRLKAGAFYPAISLEHRAAGWTNPYFISSSALNTWVGEELRTIGVEYNLDWLGRKQDSPLELGLTAAAFGWNDPAGVVVAFRGFALHDRQTPLFGRLRTWIPDPTGPQRRVLFAEIDGRPGYYLGARAKYRDSVELRAMHYDNRADPGAFQPAISDSAWETCFNSAGLRIETPAEWTFIVQWLAGTTFVGAGRHDQWQFDARFALLARELGKHRLAARVDRFASAQTRSMFPGNLGRDSGDAWSVAWTYRPLERLEFTGEYLRVKSNYNWRRRLAEDPRADERGLQLSVRYSFELAGR